jgi:RimJ/RimL family protein N-acetyltransferase
MPTIPLEAERRLLREFVPSDWRALLGASGPEEVRHMHEEPYGEVDARERVAGYIKSQSAEPRTRYELAVVVKATDRLIGYCDLVLRSPLDWPRCAQWTARVTDLRLMACCSASIARRSW